MKTSPLLVFEDTLNSRAFYFENPVEEIKVTHIEDLEAAFSRMEDLRKSHHFLAGVISYELGMTFFPIDKKAIKSPRTPWLHFFAFQQRNEGWPKNFLKATELNKSAALFDFSADTSEEEYEQQQQILREHLLLGDIYQQNQTYQKSFRTDLSSHQLYLSLRDLQKTRYSAFLNFSDYEVLSFSPELFYKKSGSHILTEPMKGTLSLDQKIENLTMDEKSIAENLMIVDLLRNDLGKIAKPGSVTVDRLFEVQKLSTVYQMVSRISAEIDPHILFKDLLTNLFPCGSITGAPKWSAMEQIHLHEKTARGVYTGAIGVIEPNNDQVFNVAIRTITRENDRCYMGVGGGIVADSVVADEYKESQLKGRFLRKINQDFYLFETFLYDGIEFRNLEAHKQRISKSASFYDFEINWQKAEALLRSLQQKFNSPLKMKLMLSWNGDWSLEHQPLKEFSSELRIALSTFPIDLKSHFQAHKTSHRQLYDQEWERAQKLHLYDLLFLNQNAEVVECSRHNIFIKKGHSWFTPPLSSGALPGIERQNTIAALKAQQESLFLQDVMDADEILLTNSVRGRVPVSWVPL